jgi:hypothetical protein
VRGGIVDHAVAQSGIRLRRTRPRCRVEASFQRLAPEIRLASQQRRRPADDRHCTRRARERPPCLGVDARRSVALARTEYAPGPLIRIAVVRYRIDRRTARGRPGKQRQQPVSARPPASAPDRHRWFPPPAPRSRIESHATRYCVRVRERVVTTGSGRRRRRPRADPGLQSDRSILNSEHPPRRSKPIDS